MKIFCKVTDRGLVPIYESDLEEKRKLKNGKVIEADIKYPRNYEFHKKFFALLRLTLDNMNESLQRRLNIYDLDTFLRHIKIDMGLYEILPVGNMNFISYGSISFENMDETAFQSFYRQAVHIVLDKYLPGNTSEEIKEEILKYY